MCITDIMHGHLSLRVLTGTASSLYLLKGTEFLCNGYANQKKIMFSIHIIKLFTQKNKGIGSLEAQNIFSIFLRQHLDLFLHFCQAAVLLPGMVPFSKISMNTKLKRKF